MRRMKALLTAALVAGMAIQGFAQGQDNPPPGGPPGRGPGGRGPGGPGGPGGFGGFGGGMNLFGPANPLVDAVDADLNGEVSAEELANAAVALKKLDKDGDGKLSSEELRPVPPTAETVATKMMAQMDKDKDGKLVVEEVPEQMLNFVGPADGDGNGEITKDELTKFATTAMERMRSFGGGRGFGGGRPGGEGGRPPGGGEGGARPERPARPE